MATDGSDSHGAGDTLAEYHFRPIFKEYILKEQLKWSLYKWNFRGIPRLDLWVFWSEQNHEIEPSQSLSLLSSNFWLNLYFSFTDNRADFNPNVCAIRKVRDNIRLALQKLIQQSCHKFTGCLVQFWAATTTSEGQTLVTTQNQPFALGGAISPSSRVPLCNYRMKMCSGEYNNCFYANAPSGEELGLPGRVFLHQYPESTPDVKYYSTKEYPQRDLALRCKIRGSWAMPVFELYSRTCVGVLEMVSSYNISSYRHDESFLRHIYHSFQEFGLQCFDGYKICEMRSRENVKTNNSVFQELETVMRLVCETHRLPLAMAWVPCSACNGLRPMGVKYCACIDDNLAKFLRVSECSHLRKGWVASRALSLSSPDMLYFPSITKLSVDEYPLVPYARMCKFSGCFIIFLRSNNTGDDIYVLEFFWSMSSEDNQNILIRLNKLLGTMEDELENFRFASGRKLGYLSYVDVIDVQNNQKIHKRYEIQATRTFSSTQDSDSSSDESSASNSNLRPW